MRIVYLAAGAGGMYCGSCLHDNTLAAALLALGEDVTLAPIYTPLRTDEVDVSEPRVFFGGINAYLQQKFPLFRRTPRWLDRWLERRDWAAAGQFSLADCAAAPALFYADWVHPIAPGFSNLKAYRSRLLARPSVARAVDEARPYRSYFPLGAPDRD